MRKNYYSPSLYTLEPLKEDEKRFGLVRGGGRNLTSKNLVEVKGETYVVGECKEGNFLIKSSSWTNLYKDEGVVVFKEKVKDLITNLKEEELEELLPLI